MRQLHTTRQFGRFWARFFSFFNPRNVPRYPDGSIDYPGRVSCGMRCAERWKWFDRKTQIGNIKHVTWLFTIRCPVAGEDPEDWQVRSVWTLNKRTAIRKLVRLLRKGLGLFLTLLHFIYYSIKTDSLMFLKSWCMGISYIFKMLIFSKLV